MIMQIVALYDSATESYGNPFFVTHTGAAVRSFSDEVNSTDPGSQVAKHPADYELYHFGNFSSDTGAFHIFDLPERLARALDLKAPVND